ncbi:hypothetical protein Oweho_3276 [Owenweeksia hongkongensis DSM 17368]|uniref:Uncharacterized protein n=1 Tax=Owenweeksia hongkongensis (strain DSM 17368 / CIP 108786 / JCM 12287 / NRRL B-23963 / UST20020801) TaxID=926562 RepID=G8R4C7_OWEHD|nr:DUF4230 domain-containing protein [Owenweeksia hongkongensis]AEV34227.1 hypothetical protein Oweho_3276 [Owenweeksia hongkongensis DSM 17368]
MITLISKYWKVILDAILIVALIVLVFIWNPFNVFGKGIEFKPTTNMVMEVKKIGELVTAQYYGEVVASLGEARLNLLKEDDLADKGDLYYQKLKEDIFQSYEEFVLIPVSKAKNNRKRKQAERQGRRDALKKIEEEYGREYSGSKFETFLNDTLDIILLFAVEREISEPVSENLNQFKKEKKREKFRTKRLENLYDEIVLKHATLDTSEFRIYRNQGFSDRSNFSSFYYNITEEEIKNREQLAMIGRGSVKAGFNFSTLTERNFRFDESKNILHIFGVTPTILNYDINPWFIPQQAVPGFDIVQSGRKANFLDAVKVKSYCRDKLKASALEAGILEEAQRYGEEVMKSFFSLILDREVMEVRFHDDLEKEYYDQIASDGIIDYAEMTFINVIEKEYRHKIDTTKREILKSAYEIQFQDLLFKLCQLNIRMKDSTEVPFNYFTYQLFPIIRDSVISEKNYSKVTSEARWAVSDSTFAPPAFDTVKHWFVNKSEIVNPYQFTEDYNVMLQFLEKRNLIILGSDTAKFNSESIKYVISPTIAFVDSISQVDTLNLEEIHPSENTLSALQKTDIHNYRAYLKNKHRAYSEKSWVYKWRDKVNTKVDLKKLQTDISAKVGLK